MSTQRAMIRQRFETITSTTANSASQHMTPNTTAPVSDTIRA